MQPVFVAVLSETLTDRFVETVTPPPRRYERTDQYGRPLETSIDVYMDTQVRSLGLLVFDHGFKTYAVRPRKLPKGVSPLERRYVKERGVDIGPPGWVSKSHQHVLTVERARIEAKRLIALLRTLVPWNGCLDGDGALVLDYNPPRQPHRRRNGSPISRPAKNLAR